MSYSRCRHDLVSRPRQSQLENQSKHPRPTSSQILPETEHNDAAHQNSTGQISGYDSSNRRSDRSMQASLPLISSESTAAINDPAKTFTNTENGCTGDLSASDEEITLQIMSTSMAVGTDEVRPVLINNKPVSGGPMQGPTHLPFDVD